MSIKESAQLVNFSGRDQHIIDDGSLLEWAEKAGVRPWEAQVAALEEEIIPHRYLKNFWSLGFAEQARICSSRVLVCGCGGLGGILVELLARCGVGRIRLVDMDAFAPSNLNRQLLSDVKNLGRAKANAASERIRAVNPLVEAEPLVKKLDGENACDLVFGMDLAMDALDNIEGRFTLAEAAQKRNIPFIHAAVAGWWGQISTFPPDSARDLGGIYGSRRRKDPAEELAGVLGPTPAVIGSLAALEAIRLLTAKKAAYSHRMLYFDGENGAFELVALP